MRSFHDLVSFLIPVAWALKQVPSGLRCVRRAIREWCFVGEEVKKLGSMVVPTSKLKRRRSRGLIRQEKAKRYPVAMPAPVAPTFLKILPTQQLPQSRQTELWINPVYVAKIELPLNSYATKAEDIKIQLVAAEYRAPIEHTARLVRLTLAEERPYQGDTAIFPSSRGVLVNPATVFAVQSYSNTTLLYFFPTDQIELKKENATLVIISDERGRFDEDSSPKKIASLLGITLEE